MKKKVLITGSNGFIGKNLKQFLNSKFDIVSIHRKDIIKKNKLIFKDAYAIVHCGGLAHTKDDLLINFYKANYLFTKKLANICLDSKIKYFIFLSTVNIDFSIKNNIINKKKFPYAYTKKKAEDFLLNLEKKKFKLYILRLPLVYGQGIKGNLKNLINIIKKNIPLPFKNMNTRKTVLSMTNLNNLIMFILQSKINKTNIYASDKNTKSVHQIIKHLVKLNKEKNVFFYLPHFVLKLIFLLSLKKKFFDTLTKDTSKIQKNCYFSNSWKPKDFSIKDMKKAYESSFESRKII